jgi:hypothetical protein
VVYDVFEFRRFDWLSQVVRESSISRLPDNVGLRKARERDDADLGAVVLQLALHGEAVFVRQPNIHEHDIRTEHFRDGDALCSGVSRHRFVAPQLEQHNRRISRIAIVVDD